MALIDKASLLMVPSVYEDGTLYNVLPSGNKAPDETGNHNGYDQTRADFTFSRGSNLAATRVNANGLIEKGRENIFTYSQDFRDAAGWLVSNATKVSVNETDPNGNSTAANITWTAGSGRYFYKNITQGNLLTASFYIKSNGGGNKFRLFGDGANDLSQDFTATDEWQRFEFFFERGTGQGTGITNASDNSAADLLIAFGQLEQGLVATDYIETGATTATAGVLENTPRIDYSSGAGALLLEPQRTNVVRSSEFYDTSAYWIMSGVSVEDNFTTSPEGLQNASKVTISGGATNYLAIGISGLGLTSGDVTLSCWAKADSALTIGMNDGMANANSIDLTTEWQRFEFTYNYTSGPTFFQVDNYFGVSPQNEEKVFYLWGVQAEQGSHVSSYVPTYGSAATRGADSCSVTGASDVIGQTEGTLYYDWIMNHESPNTSEDLYTLTLSDGSGNKMIAINNYNNILAVFIIDTTTQFSDNSYTGGADGARIKLALAYANNDIALYINGTQIATDSSATIPTLNQVRLNAFWSGGAQDNTSVKQLALFNERLSNTELATLTTL